MKIKMLQSKRGSEDGFHTRLFEEGETYFDVADSLARFFIRQGAAVSIDPPQSMEEVADNLIAALRAGGLGANRLIVDEAIAMAGGAYA